MSAYRALIRLFHPLPRYIPHYILPIGLLSRSLTEASLDVFVRDRGLARIYTQFAASWSGPLPGAVMMRIVARSSFTLAGTS